ncbi:MAG: FAD-dependent oxidoreductase, partial [Planctomycetota bacterium]
RVIEMADRLLPMADEALSSALADALRRQGVVLHLGRKVERIEPGGDGCAIALDDGSSWSSEKVLVAVGRSPNTGGMGLEEAGVSLDARGYVEVDEELRTSAGWVWCIGDANGKTMLAHAAMSQARGAVRSMLGVGEAYAAVVPWCVYTSPEVGWVGVTAEEAEASGGKAYAGDFPYAALGKAHAGGDASGMFRVVVDAEGVVVGGQVVGRHATEIINVLAVMVAGGMEVSKLHAVALAHPTLGEGVGEAAAAALGLATHVPAPRAKSASAGLLAGV